MAEVKHHLIKSLGAIVHLAIASYSYTMMWTWLALAAAKLGAELSQRRLGN